MKKEIQNLLTFGQNDKILKINGIFQLHARYTDKTGLNVALSHKPAESVWIELEYTSKHDKMLFTSEQINARSYEEIIREVPVKMQAILAKVGEALSRQFAAGYLP